MSKKKNNNNMALSSAIIVISTFVELAASSLPPPASSGPHIADVNLLLPPKMTFPVEYRLQGSDGCFKWSRDHHDILSVLPEYNSSNKCSTSARLRSIAPYSGRKETARCTSAPSTVKNNDVNVYDYWSDYWRTVSVSSVIAVKHGWRNTKLLKAYSQGLGNLTASVSYPGGDDDRKEVKLS